MACRISVPLTGDWAWAIAMKAWILTSRLPVSSLKSPIEKLSLLLTVPKSVMALNHTQHCCQMVAHWRGLDIQDLKLGQVKVEVELLSHVWRFVTLQTGAPPDSSLHGIFQARILEWVAIFLLQGILPTQGLNPCLLHLPHWQTGSLPLHQMCVYWVLSILGKQEISLFDDLGS